MKALRAVHGQSPARVASLTSAPFSPFTTVRTCARGFSIPPIERLTQSPGDAELSQRKDRFTGGISTSVTGNGSPLMSATYVHTKSTEVPTQHRNTETPRAASSSSPPLGQASSSTPPGPAAEEGGFRFAMSDSERGLLDHGVSPQAKDFIAQAEAEYRASTEYLHAAPGGAGTPETFTSHDPETGRTRTTTRIASPFGETYVPSSKERFASRGAMGELDYQDATQGKFLLNERAHLNLKKERQLDELMDSPMPLLEKAEEVVLMLKESFVGQGLALQPHLAESVMQLLGHASLQLRLEGRGREDRSPPPQQQRLVEHRDGGDGSEGKKGALPEGRGAQSIGGTKALALPTVPFFDEMRLLYGTQKASFAAPTPLTIEHLMTACSAVTEPHQATFQFANRLLLDCDKYVVLPTRTTYAAYFNVCRVNNAVVPFAVARLRDAVTELRVSLDAPMATELLRGLNEGGYVEEAVALLARIEHVPMTTPLLNASLETLLLSRQATACFSAYEAVRQAALRPNADTFTLLLLACEQSGDWSRSTFVLAEMQRRRIRGNTQTLNLLLKGLLMEKLPAYALQLHQTMLDKGVEVWPALENGVRAVQRARERQQLTDRQAYQERKEQRHRSVRPFSSFSGKDKA